MKQLSLLALVIGLCTSSVPGAQTGLRDIPMAEVQAAFERPLSQHPRLLVTDAQLAEIQARLKSSPALQAFYQAVLDKADTILRQEPVERIQTGRRLLSVSRTCLDRVLHLSTAYRLSHRPVYLERAQKEMLAAAAFSNWNPSHFLDVAEMTAALAIGYDWLYPDLPETSRGTIRQALLEKGIKPALKSAGWVRGHNNWNQVCNAGITLGILALAEDEPQLARELVHRAVNGVQAVMAEYEPDGAYPEGPGYWVYGTSFNVLLLAALESALGTDFGLSQAPGFAGSAAYYLHVTGPTGLYFNYPDSGSRGDFLATVYWFSQRYRQPSLAWQQDQLWREALSRSPSALVQDRLAPLALLWRQGEPAAPQALCWRGRGSNPIAMFRTSWTDPEAVYLAIKGGSPSVSHGHMDVGSFVMDADGLRWAMDLGPESYNKIESRGMDLWGRGQDAQRWKIFRYGNLSHNTLVVNGQYQRVQGSAPLIRYSDRKAFPHAVFDMSSVYQGQLAEALRGAALLPGGPVLIQDEFQATDRPTTVRWAMVTPASVSVEDNKTALLRQEGKTMRLTVLTEAQVQLRMWSTAPPADYDAPNPGTRMIGFEVTLSAGQAARSAVLLQPPAAEGKTTVALQPLLRWSAPQ
ncbi:MAG: heparinase II/III family protein [Planctomycetes bacterium]|nr:heparinase II/III family protein [Planctomycetota bacterium]